ncbi:MAG: hypothetical protein LBU80_03550 [Rikenellaceae bacterium]|jgi:hypothetical protein|nr:hypothetical protein [Rikenellaceae bacterium]
MKSYFAVPVAILACVAMMISCRKEPTDQYYTVTVTNVGNGTGTASPTEADEGAIITLTATPDEGFAFDRWTVTSGNVELEEVSASPATFSMPVGNVAVQAEFVRIKSLEGAVYHESVGAWIVPQNDPYALANFRTAHNNLFAGDLARSGESPDTRSLTATHYALKIFPKNEDEEWQIELMEDVKVSYIPFNYVGLTEQEAQELETARTSERPVFTEVSPYVVTDDDVVRTVEGPVEESVSYVMPVLYAVWPVDKPLPGDMDYKIDYEVFLPVGEVQARGAMWNENTLRSLENEAIRLALGHSAAPAPPMTRAEVVLSGQFGVWDPLRMIRVPVPRIKVKFQLGSNITETDADEDGYFSITAGSIPADASWNIVFQSPKWKITRESSTTPKNFFQGDVFQTAFWSGTNTHIRPTVQSVDATIINSLNHFYYTNHNLTRWEVPGGIRIIADNDTNYSYNGLFSYGSGNSCHITIYRNNIVNRNILAGTVFHELGHFVHFKERGGYSGMKIADRFLQESFASYVGWYLTEDYYAKLGYVKIRGEDISGQARQSWQKTTTGDWGCYSPLFVDLVDDFNQASNYGNPTYNHDEIKGLHYSVIMKIARESSNWTSCKGILREALTGSDLNTFLEPYDYWFHMNRTGY